MAGQGHLILSFLRADAACVGTAAMDQARWPVLYQIIDIQKTFRGQKPIFKYMYKIL